jgi:hypothetical protein
VRKRKKYARSAQKRKKKPQNTFFFCHYSHHHSLKNRYARRAGYIRNGGINIMKKTNKNKENCPRARQNRAFISVLPRLTLECAERRELLVCGCRKIECYCKEEAILCSHECKVRVRGSCLAISFMGESKIMLSGMIDSIEFI